MRGQIIIILLLVMVTVLAIALSLVGRSMIEISTSTTTENSSRAFSAAEAGIEKLLQQDPGIGSSGSLGNIDLANLSQAKDIQWHTDLPKSQTALGFPVFGKESFAQFWLVSPFDLDCGPTTTCYDQGSFEIYFGLPKTVEEYSRDNDYNEEPAIEVNVIYKTIAGAYESSRFFYDTYHGTSDAARRENIGSGQFIPCTNYNPSPISINDPDWEQQGFYCKVRVPPDPESYSNVQPIMVRVRILYSSLSHPVALRPTGGGSLPEQLRVYKSTGISGNAQRRLEVFRQQYVMSHLFDYVLFSAGDLNK